MTELMEDGDERYYVTPAPQVGKDILLHVKDRLNQDCVVHAFLVGDVITEFIDNNNIDLAGVLHIEPERRVVFRRWARQLKVFGELIETMIEGASND